MSTVNFDFKNIEIDSVIIETHENIIDLENHYKVFKIIGVTLHVKVSFSKSNPESFNKEFKIDFLADMVERQNCLIYSLQNKEIEVILNNRFKKIID